MIDAQQTFICHECVSDKFLKKEIWTEGKRKKCSYCKKNRKSVRLKWFADRIHSAIEEHFYLTSDQPSSLENILLNDRESNYVWERSGEPINSLIQEIAEVDEAIASDTQDYLSEWDCGEYWEENSYGDEACYEENPPDKYPFQESWDFFCQEITFRARYFSQAAERVLDELFSDIYSLETFDGKSAIHIGGPNTENSEIYRARTSQTYNSLDRILTNPVKELAAPPPKSSKHGRMNAAGISVFYGATDAETCIAEVRPPVGSQVVVGRFQIIREIRLLDLSILSQIYVKGSYFDKEFGGRKGHAAFLKRLVSEFTKPVMPDKETLEYLPTQVVAEYLVEKIKPRLDGIIFDSSQIKTGGQNIILFHNSCGIEPYKLPAGTTVSINYGWSTPEDYDDSITVFEEVPKNYQVESSVHADAGEKEFETDWQKYKDITLLLDVNSDIDVRVIMGTKYESHKRITSRHRNEKYIEESNSSF